MVSCDMKQIILKMRPKMALIDPSPFEEVLYQVIEFVILTCYTLNRCCCFSNTVAEWPPVWERAVHSVYSACFS